MVAFQKGLVGRTAIYLRSVGPSTSVANPGAGARLNIERGMTVNRSRRMELKMAITTDRGAMTGSMWTGARERP
jgi:hypothetical protein